MEKSNLLKYGIVFILGLAIGIIGGMEYKAYQVRKAIEEFQHDLSDTFNTDSTQDESEDFSIIEKAIGEEIRLATIQYTVKGSEEKVKIKQKYMGPSIAKENTKFVLVDLSVTNISNKDIDYLLSDIFIVIDSKGRQYTQDYEISGSVENELSSKKFAPSIPESGTLAYTIPKDSESYYIQAKNKETNEIFKVKLK